MKSTSDYAAMGMAAMIPGMQRAVEILQQQLDALRAALAASQNGDAHRPGLPRILAPVVDSGQRGPQGGVVRGTPEWRARDAERHRVAREAQNGNASSSGPWAAMTPEERSAEMRRRIALGKKKALSAALSAARKAKWARMTKAERAEHLAKMAAGKKRAKAVAA